MKSQMKIKKVSVGNVGMPASTRQSTIRRTTISRSGGIQSKKKKKKNAIIDMDDIVINPNLIYAQREMWTPLNKIWQRYFVHKPRLPLEKDETLRWIDSPDNLPRSFSQFIGNHNQDLFQQLTQYINQYENSYDLPEIMVITGPSGSGKTSITKIFLNQLIDAQSLSSSQAMKWILYINAKDYQHDLSILWNKISKFGELHFEKFLISKFRLIFIDNFQYISPSNQQTFKKVYLTYINKLKYIFITPDPKTTITSFFLSKAVQLRTNAIQERDALTVVLSILHRNSIGYELEGIQVAFELHNKAPEENPAFTSLKEIVPNILGAKKEDTSLQFMNVNPNLISLSLLLDLFQKVFLEAYYLSKENINKICGKPADLPTITLSAAIEPLERCPICTLFPPCSHISEKEINELGLERRSELPARSKGSLVCPEFRRYGRCTMFNVHGHCSLAHPKKMHALKNPIIRCEQCTIPWPCNHCFYTSYLNSLQSMIDEIKLRMGRLRQINVPEPSNAVLRSLESFPNWREEAARIDRFYIKPAKLQILKDVQEWIETAYCTIPDIYEQKTKLLMDTFGDLVVTDILNSNRRSETATGTGNKTEGKNNKGNDSEQLSQEPKDGSSVQSGWYDSTIATED